MRMMMTFEGRNSVSQNRWADEYGIRWPQLVLIWSVSLLFVMTGGSNQSLADPIPAGERGHWEFEEGTFAGGYGPGSRTVLDSSGLGNRGYRLSEQSRVQYTTDAYSGRFSLDLNSPADGGTERGVIVVPHDETLEPPTGMVETQIKIGAYPENRTIIFSKATFQFVNSEPGPEPRIFYPPDVDCSALADGCPEGRIVGRTAYHLEILADGRVRAIIGNDGITPTVGNGGGPWTQTDSAQPLNIGDWNHIGMSWDGCELLVMVNGVWSSGVSYEPVPEIGLSYGGTGMDPTLGPLELSLTLSTLNFVGQMDDVKISEVEPCPEFVDYERPPLAAVEPVERRMVETHGPYLLTPKILKKVARKKIKHADGEKQTDDFHGEVLFIPGEDCGPLGCLNLNNGEMDDLFRTPAPTAPPFVLKNRFGDEGEGGNDPQIAASNAYLVATINGAIQFYSKDGSLLMEVRTKDFFKPLWDSANPNSIDFFLNLPDYTPCKPLTLIEDERAFCLDSYYDTRVIFDSYNNRFWLTAFARNNNTRDGDLQGTFFPHTIEEEFAARRSKVLLAVSKTQDPRDGWRQYWWDAVIEDGACWDPTAESCPGSFYKPGDSADYPSIGISKKYAIVANTVARRDPDTFLDTKSWQGRYHLIHVMEPDGFVNGTGTILWQLVFADPFDNTKLFNAGIEPAVQHGISLYDIAHLASISKQELLIWGLKPPSQPLTPPSVHLVRVPLTEQYVGVQEAPQKDFPGSLPSKPIRLGNLGNRALKAYFRDFKLHVVFQDCRSWESGQIPCSTSNHLVRANVFNFYTAGIVPTTPASGYIERIFGLRNKFDDGASDVFYYGNPAMAVNKEKDMVVVYSRSGETKYPEARYSAYMHNESDIRPSALLHEGLFPYGGVFISSDPAQVDDNGNPKAVGNLDTGGISVDPFDDTAIWMMHAFADATEETKKGTSFEPFGNWRWVVGKVFGEVHPDLIVSPAIRTGSASNVVSPGSALTLEGVVTNQGDGVAGSSRLRVVISEDQTISGSDYEISDVIIPGMGVSGTFGFVLSTSVPANISSGQYYVLAHIDWTDGVFEYSNDNNFSGNERWLLVQGFAQSP